MSRMNKRLVGYAVFAYLASVPILWIFLAPDRRRPVFPASSGIVEPHPWPVPRGRHPLASAETARLAGCYDIEIGPWTPARRRTDSWMHPPARVELRRGWRGGYIHGFELRTRPGAWSNPLPLAYWRPERGGEISLVWRNKFAGLNIVARERGDRWVGTAGTSTDITGAARPSAPAVLKRVRCNAALRPDQRRRYDLPRGVELATGDSIRLGERLPSIDLFVADGKRYRLVGGAAAGSFAGATRVLTTVDKNGLVDAIHVRLPAIRDHQAELARLEARLGPPEPADDDSVAPAAPHPRILDPDRNQRTAGARATCCVPATAP